MTGSPSLVMLAAGLGSRFGGNKQLAEVGPHGATLMDYSIYDAHRAGCTRVVFVIREELDQEFRRSILPRYAGHLETAVVHQRLGTLPEGHSVPLGRTKPWGTAHAVLAAEPAVQGPFIVANADDRYGAAAFAAATGFLASASSGGAALITYALRDTLSEHGSVNRGVCQLASDGALTRIDEIREIRAVADGRLTGQGGSGEVILSPETPVSMNLWAFGRGIFAILDGGFRRFLESTDRTGEYYIPTAVAAAITDGALVVRALPARSTWCGLTHPADRSKVVDAIHAAIRAGEYPERLWS
jgi:CTP:molybdopterin cytidylyltransferase MocA